MNKVIIIGSGIAGLTAAIKGAEAGMEVVLVSPMPSERAQSVMAMGGINAALNTKGQNDSPEEHFRDTMKAGGNIANEKAVRSLTEHAPETVRWLEHLGTNFSRDQGKKGEQHIALRYFGGQKKMRTAYAGASTGKQIMTALIAACRKYEAEGKVTRYLNYHFLTPIIEGNEQDTKRCIGCILLHTDTNELKTVLGDELILATGGPNGVFGKTTGSKLCDGSAVGASFKKGLALANEEFIQFHPTTIETPSKRMLITEAARGEGGRLYTLKEGKPWYFMEEWYPGIGALMPRDVVSRDIFKVCHELNLGIGHKEQVYLDITHLPKETIDEKLDEVVSVCTEYGNLDPHKVPIAVYPGIHFFMGGVLVDENHCTNIENLYAIGECASQYHGANRLGGNSLLAAAHSGQVVIQTICQNKKESKGIDALTKNEIVAKTLEEEKQKVVTLEKGKGKLKVALLEKELEQIMNESLGMVRDGETLQKGLNALEELEEKVKTLGIQGGNQLYRSYRFMNMLVIGKTMVESAIARKESRGAHFRADYAQLDDVHFKCVTKAMYEEDEENNCKVQITFIPVVQEITDINEGIQKQNKQHIMAQEEESKNGTTN